ncbi:MAG: hypothetical protein LBH56_04615, partial [Coriobacteriales bacterium]|nr:hypothetical protein [Coriobacteriales bacterium]
FQTKESNPDPFTKRLILKMLAFGAALVCLVITGSTSDLSQPFVIFDGASTAVVIFFLAVQLMLFYSRKEPVPVETSVDPGVHFRAKRRYEA